MKKLILVTALAAAFAGSAMAADTAVTVTKGTVNFKGRVVNQTCSIMGDYQNQTVVLNTVPTSVFSDSNKTAMPTPFDIKLEKCKTGIANASKVRAYFYGRNVETAKNYTLKNTTDDGAKNVNIQLLNGDRSEITPLQIGAVTTPETGNGVKDGVQPVTIEGEQPVLHYFAQYYATGTGNDVTEGVVTSTVDFQLTYE